MEQALNALKPGKNNKIKYKNNNVNCPNNTHSKIG